MDFAKPLNQLASREVAATPSPGKGLALDLTGLVPADALGSSGTASNQVLYYDRVWRTVAGGGGGGSYAIVASNTTFSNTTVTISGFGAATVNTAANLIRVSVPVQTAQSGISGLAASNTTYTTGTVTITGVGGGITVSSNTGQRIDLSVAAPVAQTVQTQNMVAISASNTLFTSGTVTITGSNMITVKSSAAQGVVIDATQTLQTSNVIQAIVGSNTTFTSGTVTITGSNYASVKSSAAGQALIVDVPIPITAIQVTGTIYTAGLVSFTGAGDVTVSSAGPGQKVQISAPDNLINYFDNAGADGSNPGLQSTAMTFNTLLVQPLTPFNENFPGKMTASTAMVQFSLNHSQTSVSSSHSSTVGIGIYTRVNSTQLSILNSVQTTWAQAAAGNQTASYHGQRWLTIHSSAWSAQPVFSQGQYWMALFVRSSNLSTSGSFIGQFLQASAQRSGSIMSSVATNTTMGHYPFMGIHSVSQTSFPGSLANSDINKVHALGNFIPNLVFNNIASSF